MPIFTRIPRERISALVREGSRGQKSEMRRARIGFPRGRKGETRGAKRESRISGPEERLRLAKIAKDNGTLGEGSEAQDAGLVR